MKCHCVVRNIISHFTGGGQGVWKVFAIHGVCCGFVSVTRWRMYSIVCCCMLLMTFVWGPDFRKLGVFQACSNFEITQSQWLLLNYSTFQRTDLQGDMFSPVIFLHNFQAVSWFTSQKSPCRSLHFAEEYVLTLNESVAEIDLYEKKFGGEGTKAQTAPEPLRAPAKPAHHHAGLGRRLEGSQAGDEDRPQGKWSWGWWSAGLGGFSWVVCCFLFLGCFWRYWLLDVCNYFYPKKRSTRYSAGVGRDAPPEPVHPNDWSSGQSHHRCWGQGALLAIKGLPMSTVSFKWTRM